MLTLSSPVTSISPIAKKLEKILNKIEIQTIGDLLHHYPSRYVDLSNTTSINTLVPGVMATITGEVVSIENVRSKWKRMLITRAVVKDETGVLECVWFHQRFLTNIIQPGDILLLSGKPECSQKGLTFTHPEYEKITNHRTPIHGARIVPIYPLTDKLTQKQLRFLIKTALEKTQTPEWLPSSILKQHNLIPLKTALNAIHFPTSQTLRSEAERRLKFDTLFLLQLRNSLARRELAQFQAPNIIFHETETKTYVDALPFELTKSQKQSAWEIVKDIQKTKPMNRLLHGDVGSGKTVVASIPILNAILSGFQVAYMAPTEILAEQQFSTFCKLFEKQTFIIGLITSSGVSINTRPASQPLNAHLKSGRTQSPRSKTAADAISRSYVISCIEQGLINLVIGTHSLIQKHIEFDNLGLVIVDEQHRFGVRQRAKLLRKTGTKIKNRELRNDQAIHDSERVIPHFMSMTATPIPRTLALTVYGDLDISAITEMPARRKPIATKFIPNEKRNELYAHVAEELTKGRQAFIVCPLIDPSDKLGVKSATEEMKKITTTFSGFNIAILHGRLNAKEKDRIMKAFQERKYHILVSTPVVEVGIDIPNASIMIIESAERFGLAQLHQLRGRVGRGEHQSYCYLLSDAESDAAKQRLNAVISSHSGLALAEKDLEFRGPGDAYGVKQSGYEDSVFIARLTDFPIIQEARQAAERIVEEDQTLTKWPHIQQNIEELKRKIHPE